jgi:hypothetical protein
MGFRDVDPTELLFRVEDMRVDCEVVIPIG